MQVGIEDGHTNRHDVEYDSPLDGPKTNMTAGRTDEVVENDVTTT